MNERRYRITAQHDANPFKRSQQPPLQTNRFAQNTTLGKDNPHAKHFRQARNFGLRLTDHNMQAAATRLQASPQIFQTFDQKPRSERPHARKSERLEGKQPGV